MQRRTRASVYAQDRLATAVITVGGFLVLAAVLGICVYLVGAVAPLFTHGVVGAAGGDSGRASAAGARPVLQRIDEYGSTLAEVRPDGAWRVRAFADGASVESRVLLENSRVVASAMDDRSGSLVLGLADGSVRLGSITFESSIVGLERVPEAARGVEPGASRVVTIEERAGVLEHLASGPWRFTLANVELEEAAADARAASPARIVDIRTTAQGAKFVLVIREDGSASVATATTVRPLGGGAPRTKLSTRPVTLADAKALPKWAFVLGEGQSVVALSESGVCERYARAAAEADALTLVERVELGGAITSAGVLLGGNTLLVGDERGRVRAYFAGRDATASAPDGLRLVESDSFEVGGAVRAVASSPRSRLVAAAGEGGHLVLRHMTSGKVLARPRVADGGAIDRLVFSGSEGVLLGTSSAGTGAAWSVEPGHVEASVRAFFGPIRYEGEPRAQFVYQSSAGDDAAELKLSLVPLIWGTLKATLVAMLFAIPVGVLAAVYTSEFMGARTRKWVKPSIELMASLPSVVLGFVAAMVVAPLVAEHLATVMAGLVIVPLVLVIAAHAWQLAPTPVRAGFGTRWQLALVGAASLAALGIAGAVGPSFERILFTATRDDRLVASGSYEAVPSDLWPAWVGRRESMSPSDERHLREDGLYFRDGGVVKPVELAPGAAPAEVAPSLRSWLDGSIGTAWPGWFVALFLPCVLGAWVGRTMLAARRAPDDARTQSAGTELVALLGIIAIGFGAAMVLAWVLSSAGIDPRDSIFGPFSPRNTLVVGLIMGFAVVPIIFTISEDALRAVPPQLKSASLGVGATPWQTAIRVVLPAAGSGVFSACMIGLGRAVGETMIVLMATGNTPEMSFNLFSGLRSLSANIAVELPEAPAGSTHYRTLVLCGLVLFLMTFAINTCAEIVRQRVRKRLAAI